jgi:TPR repeat protein
MQARHFQMQMILSGAVVLYLGTIGIASTEPFDFKKLKAAAEQGNVDSQLQIGFMYYEGDKVNKDYQQASYWLKKAAERGDDLAQTMLGMMHLRGEGTAINYPQAAYWLTNAAEQGNRQAQGALAKMYEEGLGVIQDYVLAYKWYNLAALSLNDTWSNFLRQKRDALSIKMSSTQIEESQRLTREWKPRLSQRKQTVSPVVPSGEGP